MSDGYRNGVFALGLVTGGGLSLNLFLWLDYRARKQSDENPNGQNRHDNSQIGDFWDGMLGTFVNPSDTLAQWIMTVVTIIATVVLIFTLRSANKTNLAAISAAEAAAEANELIRDEQRPWLRVDWEIGPTKFEDKSIKVPVFFWPKNIGGAPTLATRIRVHAEPSDGLTLQRQTEIIEEIQAAHHEPGNYDGVIFPNDRGRGICQVVEVDDFRLTKVSSWIVCAVTYEKRLRQSDNQFFGATLITIHVDVLPREDLLDFEGAWEIDDVKIEANLGELGVAY